MEGFHGADHIVLLLDSYTPDSERLVTSFRLAGKKYPAAVIEDDGFLPEDVMSVYGFFLGDFEKASGEDNRAEEVVGKPDHGVFNGVPGKPRYFNQIRVPDYWEISGTNSEGSVHDLSHERGKIFYAEPRDKRLVRVVDWYDDRGVVRCCDHYNRYGALYAKTIFNAKGQKVNKAYFSVEGKEVIVENFVTGDIILNEGERVRIFNNKTEFVLHFLEAAGLSDRRVFFNSLSTPFFASQRLPEKKETSEIGIPATGQDAGVSERGDVLFWQEPVYDGIPGNMQIILNGQSTRTTKIYVQRKDSYEKLLAFGARQDMVEQLGFIYPFARQNMYRPKVLICTNSDRVEQIRKFVKALPEVEFHITAITEMSSKLMSVGTYANVRLYPGVKRTVQQDLFESCDYYLDINHEGEIVNAIYRAFLQNQLIFAFEETTHNRNYVAQERIYPIAEVDRMLEDLKSAIASREITEQWLERQRESALTEQEERYMEL